MNQFLLRTGIALFLCLAMCLQVSAQVPGWGWVQKVGAASDSETATGIARDASGNSYVTGYFEGAITIGATNLVSSGGRDIFIAKYASSGLLLWAHKAGGLGNDEASGVAIDAVGNCVVTGQIQGTVTFGSLPASGSATVTATGTSDVFVASYNGAGSLQWVNNYGGISGNQVAGQAISTDAGGNSYFTGYFSGAGAVVFGTGSLVASGLNADVFIAKLNNSGVLQWAVKAGGNGKDFARAIVTDAAGNSCVTGLFRGTATFGTSSLVSASATHDDVFMAKYNSAGALTWVQNVVSGGNSKTVKGITADGAGNYYLTGSYKGTTLFGTIPFTTIASESMFAAKFTVAGNFIWARQTGGNAAAAGQGNGIVADFQGNTYVTGSFSGTTTFNTSISLVSVGSSDVFVTKYSTSGTVQWAVRAGAAGADAGLAIALDSDGNNLIAGHFQNTVVFGSTSVTSNAGSKDVFVAKLGNNISVPNQIVTGTVASALLPGSTVSVPFVTAGTFINGNTFTAQLSGPSGSFASPVVIGTLAGTTSGTISAVIPVSAVSGTGYRIRVVGSNPATIGADNNADITIAALPVVQIAANTDTLALGGVLSLSVLNPDPTVAYSWTGAGLLSTTGPAVTASPAATGNFTYTITATNAAGSATATLGVAVICVPPPLATVTPGFICGSSGTATLTASGVGATNFIWYPTATSQTVLHTGPVFTTPVLTTSTTYYVLAVAGQGCVSTGRRAVTATIVPAFTVSASSTAASVLSGNPVSLSATATITGVTYSWVGSNLSSANGNPVVAAPVQPGANTYTVFGKRGTCAATNTPELVLTVTGCPGGTPAMPVIPSEFLCDGLPGSKTLTATGGGANISTYHWYAAANFVTPFYSGSTYVTPVLSTLTRYYVSAVSAEGCESPRRVVSITMVPAFTVSASSSSTAILAGNPVQLSASATTTSVTYSWIGSGLTPATGAMVAAAPVAAGVNTYTLIGKRGTCEAQNMPQLSINVTGCPSGVPTIPTVPGLFLCNGGGVSDTLLATGGGSNVSNYKWYATANASTPFYTGSAYVTPVLTTNKSYLVSAMSSEGCESPRRTTSAVVVPDFTIAATASATAILSGNPVSLSATGSVPGVSYSWVGPELSSASGAVVVAAPATAGVNAYTVFGKRGTCEAQNSVSFSINVTSCPGGTPAMPTVPGAFLCGSAGGSVTLTASGGGNNVSDYKWYTAANSVAPFYTGVSYTTPVLTANARYYVSAVSADGCESPRRLVSVTIVPDFTVSAISSSTAILAGNPTHLSASATIASVSYSWIGPNLTPATGALVIAAPAQAGVQTYTLTGKRGTCEAQNIAEVSITVTGCSDGVPEIPTVPGVFLCSGGGVSATLVATGGGTNVSTYKWYAATNAALPFHTGTDYTTPALTANKTYYVSAVSSEGCESPRRTTSVVVVPDFTVSATASATAILSGNPVSLSASSSLTGVSYSWAGPNVSSASGAAIVATPAAAGSHTISLYGKRGTCDALNTVSLVLNVSDCPNGTPTAPAVPGVFLCGGGGTVATLSASGGGSNVSNYNWYAAANAATPFFTGSSYTTPVLTANARYFVSAVSAEGCESPRTSASVTIVPDFTVAATASATSVLAGVPVSLSATASIASVSYSWVGPNLSSATGAVVVAAPVAAGVNTYTLFGKRGTCEAQNTVQLSINVSSCPGGLPTMPVVPGVALCSGGGSSVTLSASGGGSNVSAYVWYAAPIASVSFHTGASYTTPLLSATTRYYVSAITAQGCEGPRRTVTVTVVPNFSVFAMASPAVILPGAQTTLSASATIASVSYSWSGPGLAATTGASVTALPAQSGTNTYTVTGIRNGCAAPQAFVEVTVLAPRVMGADSAETIAAEPGQLEVVNNGTFAVQVYPNPFTSDFRIKLEEAPAAPAEITLQDISGRTVLQRFASVTSGEINIQVGNHLPQGVYFLYVKNADKVFVQRVVKH